MALKIAVAWAGSALIVLFALILVALITQHAAQAPQNAKVSTPASHESVGAASGAAPSPGVENIVGRIALAAYTRDLELLRRHASATLTDHYGNPRSFDKRVGTAIDQAPEVPRGEARVVAAAPANLFDEAIFYQVTVKDDTGAQHDLGVVLREPPEHDDVELTYCYLYVENEYLARADEHAALWRDLVGNADTCLDKRGRHTESRPDVAVRGRPAAYAV